MSGGAFGLGWSLVLLSVFLLAAGAGTDSAPVYLSPEVRQYLGPVKDADWAASTVAAATRDIQDDQAKLVAINRAIATRIEHLPAHPGRLSDRDIWELGNGWCDNVSKLFVTLAKAAGYPARVLSLTHSDQVSTHVIAEAYYNRRWHVFDADHEVEYYLPDGSVASFEDLSRDQAPIVGTKDPWEGADGVGMEGFYQLPMTAEQW